MSDDTPTSDPSPDLNLDSGDKTVEALAVGTGSTGILEEQAGDGTVVAVPRDRSGPRRRIGGLLAAVLGLVGLLASLALGAIMVRTLFGAADTVAGLMDPVEVAIDRMDTRIDQTDDLLDRDGVDRDDVAELSARVDGLVDVVSAARRGYSAVVDSPIYNLLPANDLGTVLDSYQDSADRVATALGQPGPAVGIGAGPAAAMADELDTMQDRIAGAREAVDEAESSLTRWLRLGALVGVLVALWSAWAQYCLLRRGLRGLRGRPAQP